MVTLVTFCALALVSCLAAAGLIASTLNHADDTRAMTDVEVPQDAHA
jgi:hypothetical protein